MDFLVDLSLCLRQEITLEMQFISYNLRLINRSRIRSLEHGAFWLGKLRRSNQGRRPLEGLEGALRIGEESAVADSCRHSEFAKTWRGSHP